MLRWRPHLQRHAHQVHHVAVQDANSLLHAVGNDASCHKRRQLTGAQATHPLETQSTGLFVACAVPSNAAGAGDRTSMKPFGGAIAAATCSSTTVVGAKPSSLVAAPTRIAGCRDLAGFAADGWHPGWHCSSICGEILHFVGDLVLSVRAALLRLRSTSHTNNRQRSSARSQTNKLHSDLIVARQDRYDIRT